jgi:hypothetical protein
MRGNTIMVDGSFLTVPLTEDAQRAVAHVLYNHARELDAALEPFGLHAGDVAVPTFERLVREDDLPDHTTVDSETGEQR